MAILATDSVWVLAPDPSPHLADPLQVVLGEVALNRRQPRDPALRGCRVRDTNAYGEPVLRSCTAVRLRLREQHLQLLGDEALESGEMSIDGLDEASRRALGAYIFLATLQEVVIQHLDPNIGG